MQLGARWQVGNDPHRSVPPALFDTIATCEQAHPSARAWTLTWLEGRPRLALDDLAEISVDQQGAVRAKDLTALASNAKDVLGEESSLSSYDDEDDDDDWLLGG